MKLLLTRSASLVFLLMWGCKPSSEGETAEKDPFDEKVVTTYEITIDPADWNAMVADPESNVWRRMTLVWEGETLSDVAVHPSGQHSRVPGNPKPSLHLSFEEFVPSRHFHHLPSVKLNSHIDDPALMRERIAYSVERSFGIAAPREVHARVVVNGQYKGLYGVEERITKKFVERWFPGSTRQIYKYSGAFADIWDRGDDPSQYVPLMFEAHVDSLDFDAAGMRDLITGISRGPYDQTAARFDIEVFLREIAVETLTGEEDAILAGPDATNTVWSNNFYLYKASSTDKYTVIGWDRNECFWRLPYNDSITEAFDRHILTRQLIVMRPENLERLKALLRELLDGPGTVETLQARFDFIYTQIKPYMEAEPLNPKKPRDFQTWLFEAADLRSYLKQRHEGVDGQVP
jgi:spore coat protein CotH